MANHGPAYGLSRELFLKSQAKFNLERAKEALTWVEDVIGRRLEIPNSDEGLRNQADFALKLRDGQALCQLINMLCPNAVKRVNTGTNAPFKQRENLELFLKGCETYGLKQQDLFQVNDLYESKGLYLVVDCIFALGGMAQKKGFDGPRLGVKVSEAVPRHFSDEQISSGKTIIGLQMDQTVEQLSRECRLEIQGRFYPQSSCEINYHVPSDLCCRTVMILR